MDIFISFILQVRFSEVPSNISTIIQIHSDINVKLRDSFPAAQSFVQRTYFYIA